MFGWLWPKLGKDAGLPRGHEASGSTATDQAMSPPCPPAPSKVIACILNIKQGCLQQPLVLWLRTLFTFPLAAL